MSTADVVLGSKIFSGLSGISEPIATVQFGSATCSYF